MPRFEGRTPYGYEEVSSEDAARSEQRLNLIALFIIIPVLCILAMLLNGYMESLPEQQHPHEMDARITTWD